MLALYLATGIIGEGPDVVVGTPALDLDLVKDHLRVRHDAEDSLIAGYLAAAIAHVEHATGRLLTRRAITQSVLSLSTRLDLHWGPDPVFADGQGLAYFDSAGSPAVSAPRLAGSYVYAPVDGWPTLMDYSPLSLAYTAGYDPAGTPLPSDLIHVVLLLVGHFYSNREAVNVGGSVAEVPLAVAALLQPYRKLFV